MPRGTKRTAKDKDRGNAARNLRRRFDRQQLSLPVSIKRIQHDAAGDITETHWVPPSEWLRVLGRKFPHCIFGDCEDLGSQLRSFWAMYRGYNPSHPVFTEHAAHLDCTIPIQLFGDEGRGQKRGNFLLWSFASAIGLFDLAKDWSCDCKDQLRCKPQIQLDGIQRAQPQPDDTDLQRAAMQMGYKGHSYVTRHLIFGLPHWCYKAYPWVVDKHMVLLSSDLGQCFRQGLEIDGKHFFAAVIGSKGDMKHQMEFGNLTRSYHTFARGRQQTTYMCSLCYAGARGIPFEDTQDEPTWATTLYAARPWNATPNILLHLPHNRNEAEEFFQLDTFHLVKVGLGRDLCGSGILVLATLGIYDWEDRDSKALPDRLQRAHKSFAFWCAGCRCKPGLRSFTKQFLNIQSKRSFPWMNTKGSDTMMVMKYLRWFAGIELLTPSTQKAEENQKFLRLLKHTIDSLLQAFSIIHSHGLWLDRPCGKLLYTDLMITLRGYKALAKEALGLKICAFAFKPKFHGLHHVAYKVRLDLLAGNQRILNPLCWMCEQDEDKVGKVSRLSRRISVRNQTSQILYRYMLKKKSCLARSKDECRFRK